MADRLTGLDSAPAAAMLMGAPFARPVVPVQLLPAGQPGRVAGEQLGITAASRGPLKLLTAGDTGGIKDPKPQNAVSYAMQQAVARWCVLFYHLGDEVYFNGNNSEYAAQFYEPYAHLQLPICGIPGNHDGTPAPTVEPLGTGIGVWMRNFCASAPRAPEADPGLEYGRHTQTQPYCDWTLELTAATIVGVWTNVVEGGHLEDSQIRWLTDEIRAAPTDRPLIVALHHPPLSVDQHHGGSRKMLDALTYAIQPLVRAPDLILSAHVHNYQRFTWTVHGHKIPVIVCGNGGYHNLHRLAPDAKPGPIANGIVFEYGDDREYGFLELTIDGEIHGSYTGVKPGVMSDGSDATVTSDKDRF